jgi:hypothetical protein
MSATDSYSTKNTKGNRKIVTAEYSCMAVFKIPDGLDLEDMAVVSLWCVRWCTLHIYYVDGREETIEAEYEPTEHMDWKYPMQEEIRDAEDGAIDYSEDEEDEEQKEKEDQYPTIEEILSKMKELKEDENDWDDDTIYDAICEWDDKFADDPNWFNEEDTDVKDSLRDRVCAHLGWQEK